MGGTTSTILNACEDASIEGTARDAHERAQVERLVGVYHAKYKDALRALSTPGLFFSICLQGGLDFTIDVHT